LDGLRVERSDPSSITKEFSSSSSAGSASGDSAVATYRSAPGTWSIQWTPQRERVSVPARPRNGVHHTSIPLPVPRNETLQMVSLAMTARQRYRLLGVQNQFRQSRAPPTPARRETSLGVTLLARTDSLRSCRATSMRCNAGGVTVMVGRAAHSRRECCNYPPSRRCSFHRRGRAEHPLARPGSAESVGCRRRLTERGE